MKTIIEEAIDAFQMNHDDRCIGKGCGHQDLIDRAKNYERRIQKDLADDLSAKLEGVKDSWLDTANIKDGSYAGFIEHIFNVAIKFLGEVK